MTDQQFNILPHLLILAVTAGATAGLLLYLIH